MTSILEQKEVTLKQCSILEKADIRLPASKSLSNRALILSALSGEEATLDNLSEARDTRTMLALLASDDSLMDVKDAGTTMRFLTAYFSVTGQEKTLTGTPRMQERPIGILVEALRSIGAKIAYLEKEGYPPHKTLSFEQSARHVEIPGNVSSQYISALLMVAPKLPQGLLLSLQGKIGSKPYIDMTLALMRHFGVNADWQGSEINIETQSYSPAPYTVEPDWSAASYWYSFCALSEASDITLVDLKKHSLQGDSNIANIMQKLGVQSEFTDRGVCLKKIPFETKTAFDFTDCPDLAQTVAVVCAVKGIHCTMTGLESLKIKETDRVMALQNELAKIGAQLIEDKDQWQLIPSKDIDSIEGPISFHSYEDHRMAMAFAPLSTLFDIVIDDPVVVDKSYPGYWKDLRKVGITLA